MMIYGHLYEFDEKTNKRAKFAQSSATIEIDGFKLGVIGAVNSPETQKTAEKIAG